MSVYYVHAPETGLVKIGFAKDAQSRFSKIQSDSPTRLILLAVEEGSKEVEAERHAMFAGLRARGEWFRHEGKLAEHIASIPPFVRRCRKPLKGALGAWIMANGHTLASFAKIAGTSDVVICRACSGENLPRRQLMLRIYEITHGEVDPNALVGVPRLTPGRQDEAA